MSSRKPFTRSVQRLGPSTLGVSIDSDVVDEHGLEAGDEVRWEYRDGELRIQLETE